MHHNRLPPFQPLTSPFVPSQQQGATTSGQPAMTFHGLSPTPGSHQTAPSSSTLNTKSGSNIGTGVIFKPLQFSSNTFQLLSAPTVLQLLQVVLTPVKAPFQLSHRPSPLRSSPNLEKAPSLHQQIPRQIFNPFILITFLLPRLHPPPTRLQPQLNHHNCLTQRLSLTSMVWMFTLCLISFRWTSLLPKLMIAS
jgi:hypothetical protein